MLLSLIFSIVSRRRGLLVFSIASSLVCNGVFFSVSMQKHIFLEKYTSHIPKFSGKDIFVISKESNDLLNPKSFDFPYKENIDKHKDVLMVCQLCMSLEGFYKVEERPEILVISLKEGVSEKKWVDTFEATGEYIAVHSSKYKYLYNKSIIARNEALRSYFSLLSLISMISYLGIILSAALFPASLYKELIILFLEGINIIKGIFSFGLYGVVLSSLAPLVLLIGSVFTKLPFEILFNLFIQSISAALLTALIATSVTVFIGRRNYVKNRIL